MITEAIEIFAITIRTSGTITARLALLTFFAEVLFGFFSTAPTFRQVSRTTNPVTTSSAQGLVAIIRNRVFTTIQTAFCHYEHLSLVFNLATQFAATCVAFARS
jgi:hypothetical protein